MCVFYENKLMLKETKNKKKNPRNVTKKCKFWINTTWGQNRLITEWNNTILKVKLEGLVKLDWLICV